MAGKTGKSSSINLIASKRRSQHARASSLPLILGDKWGKFGNGFGSDLKPSHSSLQQPVDTCPDCFSRSLINVFSPSRQGILVWTKILGEEHLPGTLWLRFSYRRRVDA